MDEWTKWCHWLFMMSTTEKTGWKQITRRKNKHLNFSFRESKSREYFFQTSTFFHFFQKTLKYRLTGCVGTVQKYAVSTVSFTFIALNNVHWLFVETFTTLISEVELNLLKLNIPNLYFRMIFWTSKIILLDSGVEYESKIIF